MYVCTFFGHRDCPDSVKPLLYSQIEDLIINHNVSIFYVGNHGRFDALVRSVLRDLSIVYPEIGYGVALARMPGPSSSGEPEMDTILPEGIEDVHPRYAVTWRNRWMLRNSDMVVAYVTHSWGSAARFCQQAQRQEKPVFNLADRLPSKSGDCQTEDSVVH